MKILFVDDDPVTCAAIKGIFKHMSMWTVKIVQDARTALKELAGGDYNIVVSDMVMPEMNGADLLEVVKKRHPNMVRIIFSGEIDREISLRVSPIAHQFLPKPVDVRTLKEAIRNAHRYLSIFENQAILEVVRDSKSLPADLKVYSELIALLNSDNTNINRISDIIKQDPAMSAKILQLVNSSFFVRSAEITSIKNAVVRLGLRFVKELVLMAEIFTAPGLSSRAGLLTVDKLQNHCMATANIAAMLFTEKKTSENAFTAGILHDVGKLLLAFDRSEQWKEAVKLSRKEKIPKIEAERKVFGFTHAEVGAYLLHLWQIPNSITEAVATHHDRLIPIKNIEKEQSIPLTIPVAIRIANQWAQGNRPDKAHIDVYEIADKVKRIGKK
ncbi:MAG: response regulator [Deltaproteobacteria bacterium]|nr:response regulator [Deltaproteobacteria bacterium]